MKTNTKLISAVVAATLGLGTIAPIAYAEGTTTDTTTTATQDAGDQIMVGKIAVPAIGITLLNDVHQARVAMFDGQIDAASGAVAQAASYLGEPAAKFAIKLSDGTFALPIDSGLNFAEGFTPDQSHAAVINAAGEMLQKGDATGAIKTMRDAGIELAVNVVVVPFKATVDALETVVTDLEAEHVHKANMLLKSVETSPKVVSFSPDKLPKQGYALDEIFQ